MKIINKKRKLIEVFLVTGVLVVMLCSLVSAVGLSLSYHDLNNLKVGPGETKDVVFGRFQNTEDEDVTLNIELKEGGEIATLTSGDLDSFVVPSGRLDMPLNVRVSIPEEIAEGTTYKITIGYKDITSIEGEGMITMTESKSSSIPVLVQKPEEKPAGIGIGWILLIIILIIVVIVVIYLIARKKTSVEPTKK